MITKNVSLWLGSYSFPVHVRVSQFDTMWRFIFDIVENSQPWEIPSGATAVLNGRKPDGNAAVRCVLLSGTTPGSLSISGWWFV